jgi:hypothetical protein
MNPDFSTRFGGGASGTFVNPVCVAMLAATIVLMFVLPRRYVIIPVFLTLFLLPVGQQINVAGVHLYFTRILVMLGGIRVISAKMTSPDEVFGGGFTSIDKIFLFWAGARSLCTILEFVNTSVIINQAGFLCDVLGGYILLRYLIRDEEDMVRGLKTIALVIAILAFTTTCERVLGRNFFGYIGGRLIPATRDGAIRAQGTFADPIRCGTFAATLLPLFIWLWQEGKSRSAAIVGFAGGIIIVLASASSTPIMSMMAIGAGILMWPLRKNMRPIRWGMVIFVVLLHMVMKAPVWFAISHVDIISGNSGYHRAMLIDQLVRHFGDWWLIGVQSTAGWAFEMTDQANQFVYEAESGGLITLVAFIMFISYSFGRLGDARKVVDGDKKKEWMFWLFGLALLAHVVSFFGIAFNDQAIYSWFFLFAMICAATSPILAGKTVKEVEPSGVRPPLRPWQTLPPRLSGDVRRTV